MTQRGGDLRLVETLKYFSTRLSHFSPGCDKNMIPACLHPVIQVITSKKLPLAREKKIRFCFGTEML